MTKRHDSFRCVRRIRWWSSSSRDRRPQTTRRRRSLEAPLLVAASYRANVLDDETVSVLLVAIARVLVDFIARDGVVLQFEFADLVGARAKLTLALLGTEGIDDQESRFLLLAVRASILPRKEEFSAVDLSALVAVRYRTGTVNLLFVPARIVVAFAARERTLIRRRRPPFR